MFSILLFLHVIGSVLLGSFITFPFLIKRLSKLNDAAKPGFLSLLISLTKVAHYALIVVLLTGLVLVWINYGSYTNLWMGVSLLLLLLIGAMMGIMSKRMGAMYTQSLAGDQVSVDQRLQTFSWICALAIIIVIYVMINPTLF